MLPNHFASRRTRHVHGHIAAADHNDFLADGELVAQIHVEQKIDALVNPVKINARNRKIAAAMRAHGDQHRIEALMAQIRNQRNGCRTPLRFPTDIDAYTLQFPLLSAIKGLADYGKKIVGLIFRKNLALHFADNF